MQPQLVGLVVGDPAEAWRAAGFAVDAAADGGVAQVGTVAVRFDPSAGAEGIVGWALAGAEGLAVDGLAPAALPGPGAAAGPHPNGVRSLDHVVVVSPDRDRTVAALAALGVQERRVRDVVLGGVARRQTFFRLGEPILELVTPAEPDGTGPAAFWGLAFTVDDLDATADLLGDALGGIRPAVQPGRRIASLRHGALGISVPVAFLSPSPPRPATA